MRAPLWEKHLQGTRSTTDTIHKLYILGFYVVFSSLIYTRRLLWCLCLCRADSSRSLQCCPTRMLYRRSRDILYSDRGSNTCPSDHELKIYISAMSHTVISSHQTQAHHNLFTINITDGSAILFQHNRPDRVWVRRCECVSHPTGLSLWSAW